VAKSTVSSATAKAGSNPTKNKKKIRAMLASTPNGVDSRRFLPGIAPRSTL
jgi:hypothetical protein